MEPQALSEQKVQQMINKSITAAIGNFFNADNSHTFEKHIQILNGRHIQVGKGVGTKIGTETTQKIGFYGKTPVVQAGAITTPATQSGAYVQADVASLKTAIDAIRVALTNLGLTA